MSDNFVGFYGSPMAGIGAVRSGNVAFSNSPMYDSKYSSDNGITVYPMPTTGPANGTSPRSTTGSETAVVTYTVKDSEFFTAHEAIFSYPTLRTSSLYKRRDDPGVGITTLSLLNLQLQNDWREIEKLWQGLGSADAIQFADGYRQYGEAWFTMGGRDPVYKWANVAKVMQNDKLRMFRMASRYGLHGINFLGINRSNREVNLRVPLGQISVLVAGPIKVRNYWGNAVQVGCKLGFYLRKAVEGGPYQIVPWSSADKAYPNIAMETYSDHTGASQFTRRLTVARLTHTLQGVGLVPADDTVLGLSESIQDITELSAKISQMDVVETVLFTSSRHFI